MDDGDYVRLLGLLNLDPGQDLLYIAVCPCWDFKFENSGDFNDLISPFLEVPGARLFYLYLGTKGQLVRDLKTRESLPVASPQ